MANDYSVSNYSVVDIGLSDNPAIFFNLDESYPSRPVSRTVSFCKWHWKNLHKNLDMFSVKLCNVSFVHSGLWYNDDLSSKFEMTQIGA